MLDVELHKLIELTVGDIGWKDSRFLVCPLLIVMVMLSGCLYDSGENRAKSEHNDTSAEIRDFFER